MPAHTGSMLTYWFMLSLLAIVTTFGLGTTINMLTKKWWVSIVLVVVFAAYVLIRSGARLAAAEWVLLGVAVVGALLSSWAVRALKKRGYPLFS